MKPHNHKQYELSEINECRFCTSENSETEQNSKVGTLPHYLQQYFSVFNLLHVSGVRSVVLPAVRRLPSIGT